MTGTQSGNEQVAQVEVDDSGKIVEANDHYAHLLGYEKSDLVDMKSSELLYNVSHEEVRKLERLMCLGQSCEPFETELIKADETVCKVEISPVESKQERVVTQMEIIEEGVHSDTNSNKELQFHNISAERVDEISNNVRVDCPGGKMQLNEIMFDLMEGQCELDQFKRGAITLHQCLDERLEEEEKHNPDSDACEVIESLKESAMKMYNRIE